MTPTHIENLAHFQQILAINPGVMIFKFGAEWCAPCKKIEGLINEWFANMPSYVQTFCVDVDESFELYATLKHKKMVHGIPAILAYYKGNTSYVFDYAIAGTDTQAIEQFFKHILTIPSE